MLVVCLATAKSFAFIKYLSVRGKGLSLDIAPIQPILLLSPYI